MALQVVSAAVSVHKVTGVDSNTGQTQATEHIYKRGEILPDWVSPFQQFTLTHTGMAREVGDLPDPGLVRVEDVPAPVVLPEHNPMAVVGSGVVGPTAITSTVYGDEADAPVVAEAAGPVEPLAVLPDDGATKPVWEQAGVDLGMKRGDTESMRKADLVKAVKSRQDEALAAQEDRDLHGPDTDLPPALR